jgi:hypothetical protein
VKKSILREKSFKFAVRIVNLYKYLCEEKKEFDSINADAVELIKMITSSIKTAKKTPLTTNH